MTTPEQRLIDSLSGLRALVDSLASRSPSEAEDLLRLDLLVRRYPAAARTSLRLLTRSQIRVQPPGGWSRRSQIGGVPLWQWGDEAVYLGTGDMDQLRFVGAALRRFDTMSTDELRRYIGE